MHRERVLELDAGVGECASPRADTTKEMRCGSLFLLGGGVFPYPNLGYLRFHHGRFHIRTQSHDRGWSYRSESDYLFVNSLLQIRAYSERGIDISLRFEHLRFLVRSIDMRLETGRELFGTFVGELAAFGESRRLDDAPAGEPGRELGLHFCGRGERERDRLGDRDFYRIKDVSGKSLLGSECGFASGRYDEDESQGAREETPARTE